MSKKSKPMKITARFAKKKKNINRSFSRLSKTKKRALIFIILFALVGSIVLIKSFAYDSGVEQDQYDRINAHRAASGRAQLATSECLAKIARNWAQEMANRGDIPHNDLTNYFQCGGNNATENVGRGPSSETIFNAYVASPGHNANMLDTSKNGMGVGAVYQGGQWWIVHAFSDCGSCGVSVKRPPPPGSNFRGLAVAVGANSTQGYKVNGRGEMWTLDSKYQLSSAGGWNADNVRGIAVNTNWKGYKLDLYGGLHPFSASGPSGAPPAASGAAYFPGQDIARDVKLAGSTTKGYVLDGYGGIHPFNGAPKIGTGAPYWPGWDIAKKFGIIVDNNNNVFGGYVLDGFGGLSPFRIGNYSKPPAPTNNTYWPGVNIARSIALSPDGKQGFVLDGYGGIHGFSQPGTCKPVANGSFYTAGADLSVDIVVRQWNGCSASRGHTVDVGGGIHSF